MINITREYLKKEETQTFSLKDRENDYTFRNYVQLWDMVGRTEDTNIGGNPIRSLWTSIEGHLHQLEYD